jgi:hypothetical protein
VGIVNLGLDEMWFSGHSLHRGDRRCGVADVPIQRVNAVSGMEHNSGGDSADQQQRYHMVQ